MVKTVKGLLKDNGKELRKEPQVGWEAAISGWISARVGTKQWADSEASVAPSAVDWDTGV